MLWFNVKWKKNRTKEFYLQSFNKYLIIDVMCQSIIVQLLIDNKTI